MTSLPIPHFCRARPNNRLKAVIKLHAAAKLHVINEQAQAIVRKAQLDDYKPALDSITAEIVRGIATSARTWLERLQLQTEQELQSLEEQLQELKVWGINNNCIYLPLKSR